ncbi:MAG TPA: hypothetical protein VKV04_14075 [Verrucomicrobiae bacterium]|nr:hypothetical protein [Verrucomicrobiae bacterium]
MCAIDRTPFQSSNPTPKPAPAKPPVSEEVQPAPIQPIESIDQPEEFRCLWRMDPFAADIILKKFEQAGIQFEVVQLEMLEPRRIENIVSGYPPMKQIDVYVHMDDKEKAMEIITADWKV